MWSLPQRVGIGMTREILMFCDPVKGEQAKAIGLADRLAEPGQVLSTAIALAEKLAALPPATMATTKAVLSRLPMSLDTMLAWVADTHRSAARRVGKECGITCSYRRSPSP